MAATVPTYLSVSGATLAQAHSSFELDNFNITTALKNYSINISTIPAQQGSEYPSRATACQTACNTLKTLYSTDKVLVHGVNPYTNFTNSFWSAQQAEVHPHCVFKPSSNRDVAITVLLSRLTSCPFQGSSNSPGGITIWFKNLSEVTLNEDQSVASIGPGNTWGKVYRALEPYGLAVVGGRLASIGVGGLITGGGISFHSNLYGWALDNVESYEVVTASGQIVIASVTQHPDLYWGLRGGGNNLGLVTKFNLYTIPFVNAFIKAARAAPSDGKAQQWVVYAPVQGTNIASTELTYAEDIADPAIFAPYMNITALSDTRKSTSLAQLCEEIDAGSPNGLREMYWPIATHLDQSFALWVARRFFEAVPRIANVSGAQPGLGQQAITEPILANMTKAGGNALGLDASRGPLLLMHLTCWWQHAGDDAAISSFMHDFWETVQVEAEKRGIAHRYIYMNYASQFQNVIAGYGVESNARLRDVATTYDPHGVFQKLQPGYFKLEGSPVQY
ncbi:hypothetical protein BDV25DRAFT_168076 [Aspergillus avenaceus]|uniref:FAD-binding PCMH-type domain-containing protein n=1 Tax=Aspergillus avenaceus TaxID=36643 RepID=A0A5N6TS00_ASPAV|nr:hypothetical protein BDV25DRAFT_168076 [Aspergillus avenaceus]